MKKSTVVGIAMVTQVCLLYTAFILGRMATEREAVIEAMNRTLNSVYTTVARADSLNMAIDHMWPDLQTLWSAQSVEAVDR